MCGAWLSWAAPFFRCRCGPFAGVVAGRGPGMAPPVGSPAVRRSAGRFLGSVRGGAAQRGKIQDGGGVFHDVGVIRLTRVFQRRYATVD